MPRLGDDARLHGLDGGGAQRAAPSDDGRGLVSVLRRAMVWYALGGHRTRRRRLTASEGAELRRRDAVLGLEAPHRRRHEGLEGGTRRTEMLTEKDLVVVLGLLLATLLVGRRGARRGVVGRASLHDGRLGVHDRADLRQHGQDVLARESGDGARAFAAELDAADGNGRAGGVLDADVLRVDRRRAPALLLSLFVVLAAAELARAREALHRALHVCVGDDASFAPLY